MLNILSYVLAFIVAIGILVAVHEFGHYWVARRLGFKVLRFSIGFGRPLIVWHGRDADRVEYCVSAIPLGGYVRMLDEREGSVPDADRERAFNRRPIPHRIAVLLAGPGFNFLFAIIAYWAMFVSGVPGIKPIVGAIAEDSVAARAGLQTNDEIVAIGGESVRTWEDAIVAILDELLSDGQIEFSLVDGEGEAREVALDLRGRESELTEPEALFDGLGFTPGPVFDLPVEITGVTPDSPAEAAGLQSGDRIVRMADADGSNEQTIRNADQWVQFIRERPGASVLFQVMRGDREIELRIDVGTDEEGGVTIGRIGASGGVRIPPEELERIRSETRYGFFEGFSQGVEKTWEMTALTVRMLMRMVVGDVSLRNVSGPITIAQIAGDSAAAGLNVFLGFLGIVSLSLGIMNLLPIPLLDGGQVVYQVAEAIKGSPLSERAMEVGQQIGIFFLIALVSLVFYNDISRLLN